MSYQRLVAEHARIDAAMLRLQTCAESATPNCAATVSALAHAATLLRDHITHEGACLYSDLIASGAHPFSQTAKDFTDTLSVLERDCVAYFTTWNAASLAADWPMFRRETRAIAARLVERGVAENALLYMAALRESVIPLRSLAA